MKVRKIIRIVEALYGGYVITYGKAWRAKHRAWKMICGDWEDGYEQLPVRNTLDVTLYNQLLKHCISSCLCDSVCNIVCKSNSVTRNVHRKRETKVTFNVALCHLGL